MHEGVVEAVVVAHELFVVSENQLQSLYRYIGSFMYLVEKISYILPVLQLLHREHMHIFEILHIVGSQRRTETAPHETEVVHQDYGQLALVGRGVLQDHNRYGSEEESHTYAEGDAECHRLYQRGVVLQRRQEEQGGQYIEKRSYGHTRPRSDFVGEYPRQRREETYEESEGEDRDTGVEGVQSLDMLVIYGKEVEVLIHRETEYEKIYHHTVREEAVCEESEIYQPVA